MSKPIHTLYHETKRAMSREKPRSRKRIILQNELRDLMTRQMAKETGYRRRRRVAR